MRPIDADAAIEILETLYPPAMTLREIEIRAVVFATLKDVSLTPTIHQDVPRVMTLADIWEAGEDKPLFIEYKLPSETKLKPAIFQPDNSDDEYMCVVSAWCASGFYSSKSYNMDWRCWTARPTDEQRMAVKWD